MSKSTFHLFMSFNNKPIYMISIKDKPLNYVNRDLNKSKLYKNGISFKLNNCANSDEDKITTLYG